MTLRGHVTNGVVVLQEGHSIPEGTLVEVTPLLLKPGDPATVIAAMRSAPTIPPDWVDDLERLIAEGKNPPAPPVSFFPTPDKLEGH